MTRDFYDKFPSVRPKPIVKEIAKPNDSILVAATKLKSLLSYALPLLQQYADFEPHAIPIRVNSGFNRGLMGAWVFNETHYRAVDDEAYHPSSTTSYLLTDNGYIGKTQAGIPRSDEKVMQVDRVRLLSTFSIIRAFPEGVNAVTASQNLTNILTQAGTTPSLPFYEN